MKRRMLLALATALVWPAVAGAQQQAPASRFGVTLSPFLGYAFTYNQHGTAHFTDGTVVYAAQYQRQVEGGYMPGAAVEFHAPGRFGLSAAVAYNHRGDETLGTSFQGAPLLYAPGGTMIFARAAITMDLRESDDMRIMQPKAEVWLGPAMIHDRPDASTGRAPYTALAINGAASAEMPLPWRGMAVRAGLEDYMAYLPTTDLAAALATDVFEQTGQAFGAQIDRGATHMYVIEAALAYHF